MLFLAIIREREGGRERSFVCLVRGGGEKLEGFDFLLRPCALSICPGRECHRQGQWNVMEGFLKLQRQNTTLAVRATNKSCSGCNEDWIIACPVAKVLPGKLR